MPIITKEEKERLVSLGSEGIMREIADGKHCQPSSPYRDELDAVLAAVKASEDAAFSARAEAREEINLSISRKALRNSHIANALAAIATVIVLIAIFK